MIALAAAPVTIHTSPADVPSVPAWFADVTVLARHCAQRGLLDAISQQVRLARGRAGHDDVIDFVALLLGDAVSGEATIAACRDRLAPCAGPFLALFGRDRRPHRATLSRVLAAVDAPCLAALRQLVLPDLGQHGATGDDLGGVVDRQGQRRLVVDVDGTRQAARQRAKRRPPTGLPRSVGCGTPARQATPGASAVRSCAPGPPCSRPTPRRGSAPSAAPATATTASSWRRPAGR